MIRPFDQCTEVWIYYSDLSILTDYRYFEELSTRRIGCLSQRDKVYL